jgi:hypothetical protein
MAAPSKRRRAVDIQRRAHADDPLVPESPDLFQGVVGLGVDDVRDLYRDALAIVRDKMGTVDTNGTEPPPEQLALAAMVLKRMAPSHADTARISSAFDVGPNDLISLDACRGMTLTLVASALAGALGIGETERLVKLVHQAAAMNFAADLDQVRTLHHRLNEITSLQGPSTDPDAPTLGWGRFSAPPTADGSEPVEDADAADAGVDATRDALPWD